MTTADLRVDVAIIGGGPVGGVLALALGDAGLSVAVIERETRALQADERLDGRGWAIAAGSRAILDRFGMWDAVAPRAGVIADIRVTDGADTGGLSRLFLHFDHREMGDQPMGWIVEAPVLRAAVGQALSARPIAWRSGETVVEIEVGSANVRLTLASGTAITAGLVVGADGRASLVRSTAGIPVADWSYGQTAIVAAVRHAIPHGNVAHERFLPGGPLALLPLADAHTSSIVWTERTAAAERIYGLTDDRFERLLASRFGSAVGAFRLAGPRWRWPLGFHLAARTTAPRLVLIGDAAHGMHPIAGQGLNLGLRDAAVLADALDQARKRGCDAGDASVLAAYEASRRTDTVAMMAATDLLNRLFSNDIAPVRLARTIGLAAVERLPGLKRAFMRRAMGIG